MFENELQTRAAICGTGCLLGLVLVLAHLPLLILIVPIAVASIGASIVALYIPALVRRVIHRG